MIQIVTPPALEPLALASAKVWLKVDFDAEDDLIQILISAAREKAEHYTNRKFITTTVSEKFDIVEDIALSLGDVISVVSVDVGETTLVVDTDYTVELNALGATTVTLNTSPAEAPAITYTVGYGPSADDVPKAIVQAMLFSIAEFYENRTDRVRRLPTVSEYLLNSYRRWTT